MNLATAPQAQLSGERLMREAQLGSKLSDVHASMFAYCEQDDKRRVRNAPADRRRGLPQNANMAKKATGPTDYEALRQSSGWYAAAWRDYRKITQQELADEVGSSRGQISDLETGAKTRYNRDWVAKFADALNVRPGFLIDVNPFTMWEHSARLSETIMRLPPEDRNAVLDMAERLASRTGTEG